MKYFLLLFLFLFGTNVQSQTIIGIGTRYDDSFREWIISTDDEEVKGELRMRWSFRDDWTAWDFALGDIYATIEQKWADDPNLWEIRCNGITVNARTAWSNDFTRWKLTDGRSSLNWSSRYGNQFGEWQLDSGNSKNFEVYNYWDGDPREWVVIDKLGDQTSLSMKIAMIFLSVFWSSPRI